MTTPMQAVKLIWRDERFTSYYHVEGDLSDIRGAVIDQNVGVRSSEHREGWRPFAPFGTPIHGCGIGRDEAKKMVEEYLRCGPISSQPANS